MYWRKGNTDLMRPALPEAVREKAADKTAMFPLVPYSNRIRGGYFIYWGIRRSVPKTIPSFPILCTEKDGKRLGTLTKRRKIALPCLLPITENPAFLSRTRERDF